MLRVLFLFYLLGFSLVGTASSLYQIDIIVFTHAYTENDQVENTSPLLAGYHTQFAIPLKPHEPGSSGLYQLMPQSSSSLKDAWNRLNHQAQYRPLLHYTWIQPSNNQRSVLLAAQTNDHWDVKGTIRVRQSNYYLLDTQLQFSAPNGKHQHIVLADKQRLKPGNTYYIDHPQGGMLINVHRVS